MKELINKRIDSILIDGDDQHFLKFVTDAGEFAYRAEGDCCSESWFYHVLGVDALLGQTVLDVTEIVIGKPEDAYSRQESDELYAVNIRTTGGYADVEFRNSSNGYYGGWLQRVGEDVPLDDINFVKVTNDYTAQLT